MQIIKTQSEKYEEEKHEAKTEMFWQKHTTVFYFFKPNVVNTLNFKFQYTGVYGMKEGGKEKGRRVYLTEIYKHKTITHVKIYRTHRQFNLKPRLRSTTISPPK